jgi:hypothetical protein
MNFIFKFLKDLGERGEVAAPPPITVTPVPPIAPSPTAPVTLPPAGDGKSAVAPPAFVIPDTYKDKPYLKGADSLEKVLAMLDGAETKLGQRPAGIPADTATPEEWRKFWTAMGAPEKPEGYQFDYGKNADGTPKAPTDAEWDKALKQMLYDEGISAKTAARLDLKFQGIVAEAMKRKGIADAQLNTDFDKLGSELYGAERDKVIERVTKVIKEFVNPKLGAGVAKLNAEQLMIMSSVIDNMRAKFMSAEGAPLTPAGGGGQGTAESLRAEARALMATPAYTNAFDPAHEATKTKINELYQRASQIK